MWRGNCWKPARMDKLFPSATPEASPVIVVTLNDDLQHPPDPVGGALLWWVVKVPRTQESFNRSYVRPHTSSSHSKDASCWAPVTPFSLWHSFRFRSNIYRHRWFHPMQNVDFLTSIVYALQKFFLYLPLWKFYNYHSMGNNFFWNPKPTPTGAVTHYWQWFDELGSLPSRENPVHRAVILNRIKRYFHHCSVWFIRRWLAMMWNPIRVLWDVNEGETSKTRWARGKFNQMFLFLTVEQQQFILQQMRRNY